MTNIARVEAGNELIRAARAYWELYQLEYSPAAVVWIKDDAGQLVLFTRGEYREQIMHNIDNLSDERPLVDPFVKSPDQFRDLSMSAVRQALAQMALAQGST